MLKRTLFFGNPAHLYMRKQQLCISQSKQEETDDLDKVITRPIEDIGMVVLEHKQITVTHALLNTFMQYNVAVVSCDDTFLPSGMFMPLSSNHIQSERFRTQLEASEPLKKQLWAQTVAAKLQNQSAVLQLVKNSCIIQERIEALSNAIKLLNNLAADVKSGDSGNYEARGAAVYWQNIFPEEMNFSRDRFGIPPNNLLNYGYAIVRACVARALVGSGLLPTFGIHHKNKYNAYCLADDIMEPYRAFVDKLVLEIMKQESYTELNLGIKQQLLKLPEHTVLINGEESPLMVAAQKTSASLVKCFDGSRKKILYPEIE